MDPTDPAIAAGLDQLNEGFAIFDRDLRLKLCNRRFHLLRGLPPELCREGVALADMFMYNAQRGDYGPGDPAAQVGERIGELNRWQARDVEMALADGRVLMVRYRPMQNAWMVVTYEDITEVRQADARLRAEEQRLVMVMSAVSEGIYDWNVARDELYVSDRLRKLFDFESEHFGSREWFERIHPDDRPFYVRSLGDQFKGGDATLRTEYRVRVGSGEYRWVHDQAIMMRRDDGRVRRVVGAVSDISDAKARAAELERARDSALKAQTMFENAIEAISEGFALFDAQDRIVVCNSRYRTWFGEDAAMVQPGNAFEDIVRAAVGRGMFPLVQGDVDAWVASVLEARRNPTGSRMQYLSSGVWLQISDYRMADGSLVSIYTDVTDLKVRERELDEAMQRTNALLAEFNAVLDTIDYAVLFMGPDLRARIINRAFAEMWRLSEAQIQAGPTMEELLRIVGGRGLYDVAPGEFEAYVQERVRAVRDGDIPAREIRLTDGRII
ncbi:MAG: PAS-domain containing protein, partial [Burkholderiales bacterium]